jgi:ATP-dependent DNA ligase
MGLQMTVAELDVECQRYGLRVVGSGKDGKVQKMDYIHTLERYFIDQLRSKGELLPGCEWVHTHIESPMLAQSQTCFKSEKLFQEFVGRDDTLAEVKNDGCRLLLSYYPGIGFEFFSRNRSVENILFGQYTDQIYGLTRDITRDLFKFSFVLDGELVSLNPTVNGHVVTDTVLSAVVAMLGMNRVDSHRMQVDAGYPLRMQVFDILQYFGHSVMDKPLKERKQLLHEIMVKLWEVAEKSNLPQLKWLQEVRVVYGGWDEKFLFFNQVVQSNGEGLIIKDVNAPYNPRENRGGMGAGFVKMKRTVSRSLGSDIDAFVIGSFTPGTGKYEGLVGSVDFGVYLAPSGTLHTIGSVSGLSDEVRKQLTDFDERGNMRINPSWVGRVAVIEGQDISSRSLALSHARLVRFRDGADGKDRYGCIMQEADLNALVL